ncbi:MAG: nuclear transport factor 2 family protein [Pseudomonadota bacterium]
MTPAPDALHDALLAAETAVWEALLRGDGAADAAALDDGFIGVYPDGVFGKSAHVAQLAAGPTVAAYQLSDVRARPVGDDHGLLIYHAAYTRPGHTTQEAMYVSSLWERRGAGWINIFSQDTPDDPAQAVV